VNSTVNYSGNETLCAYCGSGNHQEDHRCVRCGRRLPAPAPLSAGPTMMREMRGTGVMAAEMMVERTLGARRHEPGEARAESRRE